MLFTRPDRTVEYPTSDGRPMGETTRHILQNIHLYQALQEHFADQPLVAVHANLLMFYEGGNPHEHRSPDLLVARDVPRALRDNYKMWDVGKAPDLILELTSKTTAREDMGDKKGLYAFLGVREYYLFDPYGEYLKPPFRAYRLGGEDYLPVIGPPVHSDILALEFRVVDGWLRLFDPQRQTLIEMHDEVVERALQESARADREAARRAELETENERLRLAAAADRAELERLRRPPPS